MEILATNYDYSAYALGGILLLLALFAFIAAFAAFDAHIFALAVLLLIASIVWIFVIGEEVTYDAIVTDWNEVIEQGYEIVEQNGEIVTLRKVSE